MMVEKNERTKQLIKKRDEQRTQRLKSQLQERHALIQEKTDFRLLSRKNNLSTP